MHIKKIKGKEYYYESKRIGKHVTSVYIGPVGKVDPAQAHRKLETTKDESEEFSNQADSDQGEEDYVG